MTSVPGGPRNPLIIESFTPPLILHTPSVTLLYLHYWYYCSIFFTPPPRHPFFTRVKLSIIGGTLDLS